MTGPLAHPPAEIVVVEQLGERIGDGLGVLGVGNDVSGFAVGHGLGGATRVAGHLRHTARCCFDEHDPEPFLFEPAPPVAAQHGKHVGAAVQRRKIGVGDATEKGDGGIEFVREAPQPLVLAAAPGNHQPQLRAYPSEAGHCPNRRVETLAGHQPGDADDDLGVGCEPEVRASGRTFVVAERVELVGIDSTRHHRYRQLTSCCVDRFGGRVPAGGDDALGPAQRVGQRLLGSGETTWHGDLGAVQHQPIRQVERRTDEPERHRWVEHHEVGADVLGQIVDLLDHPRVRQQHRFACAFDPIGLAGIELGGALVGAGQHGERLGRQATPPFPQQRLDAADFRWVIVGDQEVLHDASPGWNLSWRRSAAQVACSARTGSMCAR